jgi:hypothetical protein
MGRRTGGGGGGSFTCSNNFYLPSTRLEKGEGQVSTLPPLPVFLLLPLIARQLCGFSILIYSHAECFSPNFQFSLSLHNTLPVFILYIYCRLWIRIGFNPDPDAGSQTNADPDSDPGPTLKSPKIEVLHEKCTETR